MTLKLRQLIHDGTQGKLKQSYSLQGYTLAFFDEEGHNNSAYIGYD